MLDISFSPWPYYTKEEAQAISKVFLSNQVNYWTGNEGREFEKEFATWAQCEYAVALANGTVALDIAFKALNIGLGDEVIVTPRTFFASVSSIVNAGAKPIFADVNPSSQNITRDTIKAVLTPRAKAIVCVHLAGWPCEMDDIMALAQKHNLYVIEDCAQAHGATYKGRSVGSFGHIGAWSFCQDKIMTTGGEGGMVTTNNREIWSHMWSYKDHGKSWEAVYEQKHLPGFRWLHESFGTNWRMTEMQAAIGRIQLKRMPEWHKLRRRNAQILVDNLSSIDKIRVPLPEKETEHAWYKFYVFVKSEKLKPGWDRDRIMNEINVLGVPCTVGSCSEVYLEKAFNNTGYRPQKPLPVARELGETSLMFLVHPTLSEKNMQEIAQIIREVLLKANS